MFLKLLIRNDDATYVNLNNLQAFRQRGEDTVVMTFGGGAHLVFDGTENQLIELLRHCNIEVAESPQMAILASSEGLIIDPEGV